MRYLLVLLAACHNGGTRQDFYGASFVLPTGASTSSSGNALPPTGNSDPMVIQPGITIFMPNQKRFYVEITKAPSRISLDGTKATYAQQPQASDFTGTTAPGGWDAHYRWKNDDGTTATVFLHVVSLPDADYQCQYDDVNSPDHAAAAALCSSIIAKR